MLHQWTSALLWGRKEVALGAAAAAPAEVAPCFQQMNAPHTLYIFTQHCIEGFPFHAHKLVSKWICFKHGIAKWKWIVWASILLAFLACLAFSKSIPRYLSIHSVTRKSFTHFRQKIKYFSEWFQFNTDAHWRLKDLKWDYNILRIPFWNSCIILFALPKK